MRSETDQIEGLRVVQDLVARRVAPSSFVIMPDEVAKLPSIRIQTGDVPALVGANGVEVVYAVGGYDVWINDHIAHSDTSAEVAAQLVYPGGPMPDTYRR